MKLQESYTYPDKELPLHLHYPGQHEPQPAFVQLHKDGEVEFGYEGLINAVPEAVGNHRVVRFDSICPYLTLEGIDKLHREIRPLLEEVAEGHSIEWNGSNYVGRFTEEAEEAADRLRIRLWETDWENYDLAEPEEEFV